MNKFLYYLILSVLLITACTEDNELDPTTNVVTQTISFSASDKLVLTVHIESDQEWQAVSTDSTWCKVGAKKNANDTLVISLSENLTQASRSATIKVTGTGVTHNIHVKQAGRLETVTGTVLLLKEVINIATGQSERRYKYDNKNRLIEYRANDTIKLGDTVICKLEYNGTDLVNETSTYAFAAFRTVTNYIKKSDTIYANISHYVGESLKNTEALIIKLKHDDLPEGSYYKDPKTDNYKAIDRFWYDTKNNLQKIEYYTYYAGESAPHRTYTDAFENPDNKFAYMSGTTTPKWWLAKNSISVLTCTPFGNNPGKMLYWIEGVHKSNDVYTYLYNQHGYPERIKMEYSKVGGTQVQVSEYQLIYQLAK